MYPVKLVSLVHKGNCIIVSKLIISSSTSLCWTGLHKLSKQQFDLFHNELHQYKSSSRAQTQIRVGVKIWISKKTKCVWFSAVGEALNGDQAKVLYVYAKMKKICHHLFTLHVVPNLYDIHSSAENKRRRFKECHSVFYTMKVCVVRCFYLTPRKKGTKADTWVVAFRKVPFCPLFPLKKDKYLYPKDTY